MRCFKYAAAAMAILVLPLTAQAQDQAVCDALANIMPGANSGFGGVKGEKKDKNLWLVRQHLPYAYDCELRYEKDDKAYSYACYFKVDASRDTLTEMANYATNVQACRPDMVRSGEGEFISLDSPQGRVMFSYGSHWPREFNIYIEAAEQ